MTRRHELERAIGTLNEEVRKDGRAELTGDFYYGGTKYHYTRAEKETLEKLETELEEIRKKDYAELLEKQRIAKEKRNAKLNEPGERARRNYKRKDTEIRKAKEEIEKLLKKIEYLEEDKKEYAKQYKEETGKEIE